MSSMASVKRKHGGGDGGANPKKFKPSQKLQKKPQSSTKTIQQKGKQFNKNLKKSEVKLLSDNNETKHSTKSSANKVQRPNKVEGHTSEKIKDSNNENAERKLKPWKRWQKLKRLQRKHLSPSDQSPPQSERKLEGQTNSDDIQKNKTVVSKSFKPRQVSSNWKKLKTEIEQAHPKKNMRKRVSKHKQMKEPEKAVSCNTEDIWFDDVDEELINPKKGPTGGSTKKSANQKSGRGAQSESTLVKEHSFKGLTRAVAMDCEMVGVGEKGKESVLARVSVVNQYGECLYDTFVRSREDVVDYRTRWSGVTPEKLEDAVDFLDAQKAVSDLIRGRILVGHAIHHDLNVLFLAHPRKDIRDTSCYKPYRQMFKGRTPSLKNLTSRLLSVKIQSGEHNSITDAQAAMRLYTLSRQEWEKHRKKKGVAKKKPGKVKPKT